MVIVRHCMTSTDLRQGVALLCHKRGVPRGDAVRGRSDVRPVPGDGRLADPSLADRCSADSWCLLAGWVGSAWLWWTPRIQSVTGVQLKQTFENVKKRHFSYSDDWRPLLYMSKLRNMNIIVWSTITKGVITCWTCSLDNVIKKST